MAFNVDGFNERNTYIRNSNDRNNLNNMNHNFDNSFAKMRANEHRPDIETSNNDKVFTYEEAKGDKDNFILRNNNMRNANSNPNLNNPVRNALNRNMFKGR